MLALILNGKHKYIPGLFTNFEGAALQCSSRGHPPYKSVVYHVNISLFLQFFVKLLNNLFIIQTD